MVFMKLLSLCCIVLTFALGAIQAFAQESSKTQDANTAPIYLDEPEPEPPARVSRRQKKMKETYEDKSVRVERDVVRLSDDRVVNDGNYIEYYRDGQKFCEGVYKMGVFEGSWQYWFPNGQLCKEVSFKDGKADGQWDVFNKEGIRTGLKSYHNGRRHGKWINYYGNGESPKFEISYDQGKPVGERITYFEGGQKHQLVSFKDGKMEGVLTEWDKNGKKRLSATFKAGKVVGDVQRFNDE